MRIGTPNFNCNKLTEAREARGLTLTSLSELVGISKQAISQFEKGNHTPSPPLLEVIAKTLNVHKTFFLDDTKQEEMNTVFFRSLSSVTARERTKAKRRYQWFKRVVAFHSEYFDLPSVVVPAVELPDDILAISSSKIEEVATTCRRAWNLSDNPISDLTLLLENNGFIVSRIGMDAEGLDAFSEWSLTDDRPYILSGNHKGSAVRSRFDIAHELGHLILHRHMNTENFTLKWHKQFEDQANLFASCFLLPAATFSSDLYSPTLDAFVSVKEKWKVSIAAMIMRTKQLDIIDEYDAKVLFIKKNRRWGAKSEPLDDRLDPEQPKLIPKCFNILFEQNIVSKDDILNNLRFSFHDIEELAGLPERYFHKISQASIEPQLRDKLHYLKGN